MCAWDCRLPTRGYRNLEPHCSAIARGVQLHANPFAKPCIPLRGVRVRIENRYPHPPTLFAQVFILKMVRSGKKRAFASEFLCPSHPQLLEMVNASFGRLAA